MRLHWLFSKFFARNSRVFVVTELYVIAAIVQPVETD